MESYKAIWVQPSDTVAANQFSAHKYQSVNYPYKRDSFY